MKLKLSLILALTLFLVSGMGLLGRSIVQNDEGIYWTTFLLADKGQRLYSEISFSQLPGFFLSTYSFFKLFGSSIFSARLGVFYWSFLTLLAIVWLGYMRKNFIFSLFAISSLIAIPAFFNQAITLQSDMVAVSFSTLSFVFLHWFIYKKCNQIFWLFLSSVFFSLTVLAKLDFSLVLPIGYLLLSQKKNKLINILSFSLISLITLYVVLNFFGIYDVIQQVIRLRGKALAVYPFDPFNTTRILLGDILLAAIVFLNFCLFFLKRKKDYFIYSLKLWFISSLILTFSFRPVFQHHLVFLAVPSTLFLVYSLLEQSALIKHLIKVKYVIFVLLFFIFSSNYSGILKRQNSTSIKQRENIKNYIVKLSMGKGVKFVI